VQYSLDAKIGYVVCHISRRPVPMFDELSFSGETPGKVEMDFLVHQLALLQLYLFAAPH
jgi:hypothetical protein